MSIVNFDRDLDYLKLNQPFLNFSSVHTLSIPFSTSDAFIYPKESSLNYHNSTVDSFPAALDCRSIGLNMVGPDITDGSPYRVQGYITADSPLYNLYFMTGIGPNAFLLPDTTGDIVDHDIPLLSGTSHIEIDKTFYMPPFELMAPGIGYEGRSIVFFVMLRRMASGPSSVFINCRLSVQRLGVKPPAYKTANR